MIIVLMFLINSQVLCGKETSDSALFWFVCHQFVLLKSNDVLDVTHSCINYHTCWVVSCPSAAVTSINFV